MFKFDIIAKETSEGVPNSVNFLSSNGKSHTLYFRIKILGYEIAWTPVPFVTNFPT